MLMDSWVIFLLWCSLTVSVCSSEPCTGRVNILLPKVIVPGQTTTALVHFHDKEEQHNVTLRLIRPADKFDDYKTRTDVLAQNTVVIKGNGIVWLSIPSQDHGMYEIQALLDCTPTDENCTLQTTSRVKLTGSVRDVIIRPTSNYYRPGETITFWILAVDQNLHAPNSALAQLHVKDANGISVGYWDDIPLFQGTKEFTLPISERAPLGKWAIVVKTEGGTYTSELNVSLARGSSQPPSREQVVTEKHFVELHFSNDMRRKYKPGLPLMGKVEAVSSEEEVRVRVKVIDEQLTILYSQDIDMTGREGTFIVPAVITNTDEITVQAELISLGGKDVDSQYVLARETLHKWNSESNCYLLIKDLHTDLRPDIDAEMTVLTSCASNGDMHYVVTTEGKIVSRGVLTLSNQTNVSVILDSIMQGVNIYEFNISFAVEAQMAPTSHLFVYYTTEIGEIVGDSITFNVKLLHEKVALIVDENNVYYADDKIKVGILSFPKTHICLVGGMTEEMRFGNRFSDVDSHQVLDEGLSFLTSCHVNDDNFRLPKHRSYFPNTLINQLWVWKCVNYTEEVEINGVTLPPTNGPGKWKLWALSLSDGVELRISEPATINVFSPVNVHFELPVAVKVMETVQVEITISSNINSCIDIHALIALSKGAVYPGIDMSIVSEKLRLGGYGATSIVVRIQPVTPGLKTMTANVSSYVRSTCEESANLAEENDIKASITSLITRTEQLEAVPEGIEKVHTESAYFCANEEILTLDSAETHYQYISAPRKKYNVVFDVSAAKDFHIVLAEKENSTKNVYQINLGDFDNTVSWIGRGKSVFQAHLSTAHTPNLLSWSEIKTFWLSWDNAVISVGRGGAVGKGTFLTHIMDKKMRVNHIGFTTGWGVKGRVRISEHNDESGYSQVLRLDVPRNVLAGSEKGQLYVSGGLTLPLIFQNLKRRSNTHPFSSLSSVLTSFTPILFMDERVWPAEWLHNSFNRSRVKKMIQENVQTLLEYTNEDFSFSNHPKIYDHENTVRAFEVLSRTQYLCRVDPELIAGVKRRIHESQHADGHFEHFGGQPLEKTMFLTAYTVATFMELGFEEADQQMIKKAEKFLQNNLQDINDAYTISVVGYALLLLKNPEALELVDRIRIPMRVDDDENEWQNSQSSAVPSPFDWLYEKDKRLIDDEKLNLTKNYIKDYKASAYALLIHSFRKDLKSSEPIVKYIFYRSSILDKYPEQVSYLVTKALCKFYTISRDAHPSLTISLATSGMELTDTLELKSENLPHILDLPSLPTKVFIYATGAGCSTVQGQMVHLTYETAVAYSFDFVTFIEEEIPAHYNIVGDPEGLYPQLVIKSCFRLDHYSKGIRIEAILFSGYKLDSVQSVSPNGVDYSHGSAADRLWFAFANVSANCGICARYLVQSSFIISSLRPMLFRMYEIENPQIVRELFVHSSKKDSLLRTDVTEANFMTWFGTENERLGLPNDMSPYYQCGFSTAIDNNATNSTSKQSGDDLQKIIVIDVDNAVEEPEVTDSTTPQLTSSNTIVTTNKPPIPIANITTVTAALEEPKPQPNYLSSTTSHIICCNSTHNSTTTTESTNLLPTVVGAISAINILNLTTTDKIRGNVTREEGLQTQTQMAATPTNSTNNVTTSQKPPPQLHPPKMVKHKKVVAEAVLKLKEKVVAKKANGSHSKGVSSTSFPSAATTVVTHKTSTEPVPVHRKNLNKVVVGQNELVFDSSEHTTKAHLSTHKSTRKPNRERLTTISALWGMIEEVAYDTRRKSILKS